jgi:solute carrier family 35 protein E3
MLLWRYCEPSDKKFRQITDVIPISIAFCGFVVLNNMSLERNTIGTYQLLKVLTTPTIVLIERFLYNIRMGTQKFFSLVLICIGVGMATVENVTLNPTGIACGITAVIVTSLYQIWVKRIGCSSQELLVMQAPVSAIMLTFMIPMTDEIPKFSRASILWVSVSCILAALVNISIFLVIQHTSPITYNVLGHGKLIIVLVSGYIFFGDPVSVKSGIGAALAVAGIVLYQRQ